MLKHLEMFKMSAIYSLCLSQTICVCDRQSMSVTNSLCLSQTVCVCHRQFFFFCHRQPMSVTDSVCLSQKNLCMSDKKYVCCRQYVSVTVSLCLSQTICVCHRQSFSGLNVTSRRLLHGSSAPIRQRLHIGMSRRMRWSNRRSIRRKSRKTTSNK